MRKILIVFGTRPEAIKLAPVIHKLRSGNGHWNSVVCVTAQHREMLDQVLNIFDISPQHDLDLMKRNQDLFDITSGALSGLREIMLKEKPDLILLQGDTTTAFAAGLSAYYLKIPIAHVEAGLRTYNKYSPFPEEKNRHLLSVLADYHFAPTEWSRSNLRNEGIQEERIWVTGNTVIDALFYIVNRQNDRENTDRFQSFFKEKWNIDVPGKSSSEKLLLVTGHRRENFGEGFRNICNALKQIAQERKDVRIVYPVHLNPNVQEAVNAVLRGIPNISLIDPLEYEPFIFLMNQSYLILTDSGGVQEEAPSLGKPVLVMRNTTERPEGIEAGTVKLVGTDKKTIVDNALSLINDPSTYDKMSKAVNPYGDGKAAERIVEIINSLI